MRKLVLASLFSLTACVQPGDVFNYKSNPRRTSSLVRNSTLKVTAGADDGTHTAFDLQVYVKPILGGGTTQDISEGIEDVVLTPDFVVSLRTAGDYTMDDGIQVHYLGMSSDGCDLVKVDNIPDTDQTQNLVVYPKVCLDTQSVPTVDITVTAQGHNVQIGYDLVP